MKVWPHVARGAIVITSSNYSVPSRAQNVSQMLLHAESEGQLEQTCRVLSTNVFDRVNGLHEGYALFESRLMR